MKQPYTNTDLTASYKNAIAIFKGLKNQLCKQWFSSLIAAHCDWGYNRCRGFRRPPIKRAGWFFSWHKVNHTTFHPLNVLKRPNQTSILICRNFSSQQPSRLDKAERSSRMRYTRNLDSQCYNLGLMCVDLCLFCVWCFRPPALTWLSLRLDLTKSVWPNNRYRL